MCGNDVNPKISEVLGRRVGLEVVRQDYYSIGQDQKHNELSQHRSLDQHPGVEHGKELIQFRTRVCSDPFGPSDRNGEVTLPFTPPSSDRLDEPYGLSPERKTSDWDSLSKQEIPRRN